MNLILVILTSLNMAQAAGKWSVSAIQEDSNGVIQSGKVYTKHDPGSITEEAFEVSSTGTKTTITGYCNEGLKPTVLTCVDRNTDFAATGYRKVISEGKYGVECAWESEVDYLKADKKSVGIKFECN